MRYGREHLGFVWVVLEPMLLTAGVLVLWTSLKGAFEHGAPIVELVLTGYMLLTLWRHMTNASILLHRRSIPLLYHRPVSGFDIFYARLLLEFSATTTALLFVWVPLALLGIVSPIADWGLAICGWLIMGALATGAGALILIATEANETMEKFIQPIQYLLVPLSGTFFMVGWFSPNIQSLLLINPLVHCYEVFRAGFFGSAIETHFSISYVIIWALLLNFFGVVGIRYLCRHVQLA